MIGPTQTSELIFGGKEFTAKKGIEEVALMSTAGSGYKVSSDIDFDFQMPWGPIIILR